MTCFSHYTKLQMSSWSAVVLFTCLCVSPAFQVWAGTPSGLFPAISQGLQQYTQTFFFFFLGVLWGIWDLEESNQHSLSWKCGVLNTGKSQIFLKREKGKHWKKSKRKRGREMNTGQDFGPGPAGTALPLFGSLRHALSPAMPTLFWRLTYSWQIWSQWEAEPAAPRRQWHYMPNTGAWLAPGPFWDSQQNQIQSLLLVI